MEKREINKYLPKFRTGAKSVKEFYSLTKEEKEIYIQQLLQIPEQDRGDADIYLLNYYFNKPVDNKHFIQMDI